MTETRWYKTDNVAKVFLASYNRRDTRTMRVACTLNEKIDGDALQQALIATIKTRPQFQVRIRRGFFWHYIETTDVLPKVTEETGRPCPLLYGPNQKGVLHYSVSYFGNRINFDLFHALSDGTGAMEFLDVLVANYLKIMHPEELETLHAGSGASAGDLTRDSYDQYYGKSSLNSPDSKKAYHFHGLKHPYEQLQFIEVKMPAKQILPKAKELGVSLGSYIGARLMLSLYGSMPVRKRKLPISASLPVNLRNYFPSETSRNFFNSVMVTHIFDGSETLESLAKEFDAQLKESLKPEKIRKQMDGYQKLEKLLFVRMVPLAIKQPVVRYFSKEENKRVSFVLSNLGVIKPADELKPYIESFSAFCSHEEIFVTAYSYKDVMTLGITYSYIDTTPIKDLVRGLVSDGVDVTVNASEVVR